MGFLRRPRPLFMRDAVGSLSARGVMDHMHGGKVPEKQKPMPPEGNTGFLHIDFLSQRISNSPLQSVAEDSASPVAPSLDRSRATLSLVPLSPLPVSRRGWSCPFEFPRWTRSRGVDGYFRVCTTLGSGLLVCRLDFVLTPLDVKPCRFSQGRLNRHLAVPDASIS